MEREIAFRGKSKSTGEWVDGYYVGDNTIIAYNEVAYDLGFIDISPCHDCYPGSIGQFTGLYDKNGKEIYEGDIVLTPFIDPIFGDMVGEDLCVKRQVKFNDGSFVVNEGDGFIYLECFTRNNHIEICGNIHDNQELLKDGRD